MSQTQKRVSSKMKQKQQQTKLLEQQTKKMEEKLAALRQQVQQQKKLKQTAQYQSTVTKWRKMTNTNAPLKDYAKKVLADRKQALNKYGINQKKIMGSHSFQPALTKIRSQKRQQQEKDMSKLPKFQVAKIVENKKQILSAAQIPINSIQNNFFKAKINTKQIIRRKSIQEFMQQNFLQQYLPALKANNILDLEDLYHLSREQMTKIGIVAGHQTKIIKRIKQQFDKKQTKNTDNSEKRISQQKTQISEQKVSFGYGDGDINQYQDLNQKDQQQKKGGYLKNENQDKQNNLQSNFVQEQNESEEYDQEQQEDQVILTIPQMAEFSLQTNFVQANDQKQETEQFNCFQCYRKSANNPQESSDGRKFCSPACLNKYLQFMQKRCPQCEQAFYKFNGYHQDGLWFCSIKCSPNRQKVEEMFIKWSHNKS